MEPTRSAKERLQSRVADRLRGRLARVRTGRVTSVPLAKASTRQGSCTKTTTSFRSTLKEELKARVGARRVKRLRLGKDDKERPGKAMERFPYAKARTVPCAKKGHGRTTQICIQCGVMRCWKPECSGVAKEKATAPLLDRFMCADCGANASEGKLEEAHTADKLRARAFLKQQQEVMVELDLMSGGNKKRTKNASAGNIRRMSDRIWAMSNIRVFEGADAPMECVTAYMMMRALKDKVKYDTLMNELGTMNKWRAAMKALLGDAFEGQTLLEIRTIKSMRDWAWDHCNHDNHQRDGVVVSDTASYITEYRRSGSKRLRQFALAADVLLGSLIRRDACARVRVDPEEARRKMVHFSEEELRQVKLACHWSLDDRLIGSMLMSPTWEKNQPRTVSTTRLLSDDNITGIRFATVAKEIIASIYTEEGPLLRRWDKAGVETSEAWNSDDWTEFLDHYFAFTGHSNDRKKLGAQSFRRGFATALKTAGCTEEEIRFLGYWWSTVAREYTGISRQERLNLQAKRTSAGGQSSVPRDPKFYFGNMRSNKR